MAVAVSECFGSTPAALRGLRLEASVEATAGSGEFAPLYIASNRRGTLSSADNVVLSAGAVRPMECDRRLSYGYGVELWGGYSSAVGYNRYDVSTDSWGMNRRRPPALWLQQLYGEVKWRSLTASAGMKHEGSPIVDDRLSGGDMIRSANARPIPGVRAGFAGFQPVPLTSGWLEISGELEYGRFADDGWWRDHSALYNGHVAQGEWMVYRRMHLRTDPGRPLTVTLGVQCASQIGGTTTYYRDGEIAKVEHRGHKVADFIKILAPVEKGAEDYVLGNTLGTWDLKATAVVRGGWSLSGYFQWIWEDGSGMAKLNGWDGLWGIELKAPSAAAIVSGVVVEYLDLTNQSGPIHWAPGDHPSTSITSEATGADDYYNNAYYNAYAYYGMGMGRATVMSPLYNTDGYMSYIGNRTRGIHVGVEGRIGRVGYRVLAGWRKAYGNGYEAMIPARRSTSLMAEASMPLRSVPGVRIGVQGAIDRGRLPANASAAAVSLTYSGLWR